MSDARWRSTSDVTLPTPAPTSRARIRRVGEVEAWRGRTEEGIVQRVGMSRWRNWREVSESTLGSD